MAIINGYQYTQTAVAFGPYGPYMFNMTVLEVNPIIGQVPTQVANATLHITNRHAAQALAEAIQAIADQLPVDITVGSA